MVYFSSDWHLGHKAILKYRSQFKTIEEHDNAIFDNLAKLTKRDDLIILGDFLFDCDEYDDYIERLSKFPCRIKLVLGNHCSRKLYTETRLPNLELQLPFYSYKNMWVSHCPIHPQEMRNRHGNIHGHLHGDIVMVTEEVDYGQWDFIPDERYFNVNLDNNDFKFVSLEKIKEYFAI